MDREEIKTDLINRIGEKAEYYGYTSDTDIIGMMSAKFRYEIEEHDFDFDDIFNEVMELISRQQEEEV